MFEYESTKKVYKKDLMVDPEWLHNDGNSRL